MSSHNTYDTVVIGAGVAGLTTSKCLTMKGLSVLTLEEENGAGGLIKCATIEGNLYHLIGGHVFNTKSTQVSDFFWNEVCDRSDFLEAKRNAIIRLSDKTVKYPIERHLSELGDDIARSVISELLQLSTDTVNERASFGDFLQARFGPTLCRIYFQPYNQKIWGMNPFQMPLEWLDGKLPMPSVAEIIEANILNDDETEMVHSSFFYPKHNGSQHIVECLSSGINLLCNTPCRTISYEGNNCIIVNGKYKCKSLVYTGSLRSLPTMLPPGSLSPSLATSLGELKSHGTTNLLCSSAPSDSSWEYIPSSEALPHRIIYTGNFSPNNTSSKLRSAGLTTCTVEFTGELDRELAVKSALSMEGITSVISSHYRDSTYVIQTNNTPKVVGQCKEILRTKNTFLCGRFAEWKYYNMDTAMEAAIKLSSEVYSALKGQIK